MLRNRLSESRKRAIKRVLMQRRARATGPTPETVALVIKRDRGLCVVCGEELHGERGMQWSIHHRRGRDGRPDSHEPQNLIAVCGADNVTQCHGRIHGSRTEAQDNGWWISRIGPPALIDPLQIPILVDQESRWVYLTADGGISDHPPEEAA
jgi:hypothetical protein